MTVSDKSRDATVTVPPTITLKSMTFSDGTKLELEPDEVIVFVGPNNSGKSRLLRDIQNSLDANYRGLVAKEFEQRRTGNSVDFEAYLKAHGKTIDRGSHVDYQGLGFSLDSRQLKGRFEHQPQTLSEFFCTALTTLHRLSGGDPVAAIDFYTEAPSHPIHTIFTNDEVAERIRSYFRRAFDLDLFPLYGGGGRFTLLVGHKLTPAVGEDRISSSYIKRVLSQAQAINDQGDGMRSFATVILSLLVTRSQSMLVLDEPEAFLHPPQARLLGEFIAKERPAQSQLFVATHSADILQGLISAASSKLRVVRLVRDGSVNSAKELSKDRIKRIANDPLMQYSGVLNAIFHERAFIAEADTDCMFYNSILSLPSIHGSRQPDAMFVHGGGKDRMHALADALLALGVKTDVIVDIDILRNDAAFERLTRSLGVDWSAIESDAKGLRQAIDAKKGGLSSPELITEIRQVLDDSPMSGAFPEAKKKDIERLLKQTSPWTAIKEGGKAAIGQGQPTQQFNAIDAACSISGLWIVPVGEVEGFCKEVGGHGPPWLRQVLETMDLASAPQLQLARAFVTKIWTR